MMISLYRSMNRGSLDYRVIVEHAGQLIARLTTYCDGGTASWGRHTNLGRAGVRSTDRATCTLVRRALAGGYRVLYAYVPPEAMPLTHSCLERLGGVQLTPDPTDGLPIWDPDRRARGGKPSYLLFTVLSSAAK